MTLPENPRLIALHNGIREYSLRSFSAIPLLLSLPLPLPAAAPADRI